MNLLQLGSAYILLNLLIVFGWSLLKAWGFVRHLGKMRYAAAAELRAQYLTLAFIMALTAAYPLIPKTNGFEPAVKIWAAESNRSFATQYQASERRAYVSFLGEDNQTSLDIDFLMILTSILCLVIGAGLLKIVRDLGHLHRLKQRSFQVRKVGGVAIYVNDVIQVPCSYWLFGTCYVSVPSSLMADITNFRVAVTHELQHHRQHDTQWIYILSFLKALCFFNPFIHFWGRYLTEIQEFACDEALIEKRKVESEQYIRCLIEVAETAKHQKYVPVCAAGMMFLKERNLLKRRVEKMMSKSLGTKKSVSLGFGLVMLTALTATAFASVGALQDRRISMEDARALVQQVERSTGFPVVLNELVLEQLNFYVGTPQSRAFMKESLLRMEQYRSMIEKKIMDYDAPMQLMAIPLIESGYQNLAPSNKKGVGAGLWMFIAPTARHYGLRVDDQVDERLNPEILTDAAMRYLKNGYLKFNDWPLAVLSFNLGDSKVLSGIEKTGSRDAWDLVQAGFENDRAYLAKVMAAVIIMHYPDLVD